MVLQVKPQKIISQEAIQDFRTPGADAEDLIVGPGNMPELGHHQVRLSGFEHLGQQGEMVVLNENDGAPGIDYFGQDHFGKLTVNRFIRLPLFRVKAWTAVSHVA